MGSSVAEYSSTDLAFSGIHQMPKPQQRGGVPIWVSGTVNRNAMDRLANSDTAGFRGATMPGT